MTASMLNLPPEQTVVGVRHLCKVLGLSRSGVHTRIRRGLLPRPTHRIGTQALGWLRDDLDAWFAEWEQARRLPERADAA